MLKIIVATAKDGVIGLGGKMPWHIAEDLQYFKRVTLGHTVVMGRKTFESLGRPLPGRTNVVITRNESFAPAGVEVAHSLEEAAHNHPDAFIIGGADIYRQALPLAGELYITHIDADYEGDTRFPEWNPAEWIPVSSEWHERGEKFPHPFEFALYRRRA
ncbi:MAG: dihydrofolate reductase [Alistipes sp.]|jgi:dihydrofolate reductase|nr:dihydrofolate reductase [Alistipes sp.]